MIKAILFDVDDTLYDLAAPFREACSIMFHDEPVTDVEGAFIASRKYSDRVFELSQKGEMSMEDMYAYRFENAFRDFGKIIDRKTAPEFQEIYGQRQKRIKMTQTIEELLNELKGNISLGVITNGPAEHQWNKVHALDLERWIPTENIFVSGDLGMLKPHRDIFEYAERKMNIRSEELCFVGDSFENDIEGAKGAQWQAVWFNRRNHVQGLSVKPDYIVRTEEELQNTLKKIVFA